MTVKITNDTDLDMKNHSYDLSNPEHFKGFMDKLAALVQAEVEFKVIEVKDQELYFHNLNYH